jgi:hypothetical protein
MGFWWVDLQFRSNFCTPKNIFSFFTRTKMLNYTFLYFELLDAFPRNSKWRRVVVLLFLINNLFNIKVLQIENI